MTDQKQSSPSSTTTTTTPRRFRFVAQQLTIGKSGRKCFTRSRSSRTPGKKELLILTSPGKYSKFPLSDYPSDPISSPPELQHGSESSSSYLYPSSPVIESPQTLRKRFQSTVAISSETPLKRLKFDDNDENLEPPLFDIESPPPIDDERTTPTMRRLFTDIGSPQLSPSRRLRFKPSTFHGRYPHRDDTEHNGTGNYLNDFMPSPIRRAHSEPQQRSCSPGKRMRLVITTKGRAEISCDLPQTGFREKFSFGNNNHGRDDENNNNIVNENHNTANNDDDDDQENKIKLNLSNNDDEDPNESSNDESTLKENKNFCFSHKPYNEAAAAFAQTLARSRTKLEQISHVEKTTFKDGFVTERKLEDGFAFKYVSPDSSPIAPLNSDQSSCSFNCDPILATPPSNVLLDEAGYSTGMTPYLPSRV